MQKSTAIDVIRLARAVAVACALVGLVLLGVGFGYNALFGISQGWGIMATGVLFTRFATPVILHGVLWILVLTLAKWIVGRMRFD